MPVKVLIVEDNPVARKVPCRVMTDSFSDEPEITEAAVLKAAVLASKQGLV